MTHPDRFKACQVSKGLCQNRLRDQSARQWQGWCRLGLCERPSFASGC